VMVNFAVMGWADVPLGVATSMFAGMTLGIGVDYAIHLIERYRLARETGPSTNNAILEAVATAGPAILIDGIAVAAGFGILVLSQVPSNAKLGALLTVSIIACLLSTLVLLPPLLSIFGSRGSGKTHDVS
jgi:uncharacterized protein